MCPPQFTVAANEYQERVFLLILAAAQSGVHASGTRDVKLLAFRLQFSPMLMAPSQRGAQIIYGFGGRVFMPIREKSSSSRSRGGKKYSAGAGKSVASAMRRRKKGTLKSGPGGKGGTVKSRKQAIAIGLSEARKKGAKVPKKKSS